MLNILVVDDERENRMALSELISRQGHLVNDAEDGIQALDRCMHYHYDLILCDIKMPRMDGLTFFENLNAFFKQMGTTPPSIVFMTAYGRLEDAVGLMRKGALHFLSKPVRKKELLATFDEVQKLLWKSGKTSASISNTDDLIYSSRVFSEVVEMVDRVAESSASVLFVGESGTGKELLAKRLHQKSGRSKNPFIAFHSGAVPESLAESELFGYERGAFTGADQAKAGLLETANLGTFFIDELSSMPASIQSKLLRVVQERVITRLGSVQSQKIDVRWVSATNVSLEEMTGLHGFREDLLFRLKVIIIDVPPLRQHLEDVRSLMNYYNQYFSRRENKSELKIGEEIYARLERYDWPGNIRELRNVIERAHALSQNGEFTESLLPSHLIQLSNHQELRFQMGTSLEQVENTLFKETLRWCGGDKARAASVLGVTPRTIYRWLEKSESL